MSVADLRWGDDHVVTLIFHSNETAQSLGASV
jgi:hypothetical protein